jgi:hypothetical protein
MITLLEEGAGEGQSWRPWRVWKLSTAKEGTSTVNLSAEENGSKRNSGKADAQNGQNAFTRMLISHKKAADTIMILIFCFLAWQYSKAVRNILAV